MTPDYRTMLTALGQVFASAAIAYTDAAMRFADYSVATGGMLATGAAEVIGAPADQRQAAVEAFMGSAYREYVETARIAAALPRRSTLVFLYQLDRIRGPRKPAAEDELW